MSYTNIKKNRWIKWSKTSLVDSHGIMSVLKYPIISEKTLQQNKDFNRYVFCVGALANKNDVIAAIKYFYNMIPVDVSLLNTTYKWRSSRKLVKKPIKKAIITMSQGDVLDI